MASGLLPLVVGRATRLAALLSGARKVYDAEITLGTFTNTDDAQGTAIGDTSPVPPEQDVAAALASFQGPIDQMPPEFSAKRVGGRRAYDLARRDQPIALKSASVVVYALEIETIEGRRVRLRLDVSAGFYVRALARDLGSKLGCGGHLSSLRRTRSGTFRIEDATSLEVAERDGDALAARLVTPAAALPHLPVVRVTDAGLIRARHGNLLGPEHLDLTGVGAAEGAATVRILAPDGHLVALARPKDGALHPVVVLG
jgi:tRNA pseudouridine55 synthase